MTHGFFFLIVHARGGTWVWFLATVTSEGRKHSVVHAIVSHNRHRIWTLTHTHTHALKLWNIQYTHTKQYTWNQFNLPRVMPVLMMTRLPLCKGPITFIVAVAFGMCRCRGWSEVKWFSEGERGSERESETAVKILASEFNMVSYTQICLIITRISSPPQLHRNWTCFLGVCVCECM